MAHSPQKPRHLLKALFAIVLLGALAALLCVLTPKQQTLDGKNVYISTTPGKLPAFMALPKDQPIEMLNLLRLKDVADYETGSGFEDKGWSGADAYYEYSRRSQVVIDRMDAEIVYSGRPELSLIGPEGEDWDAMFVLRYKDVATFRALLTDPEYKAHAFHRKAGVADSRLVRMAPAPKVMPKPK